MGSKGYPETSYISYNITPRHNPKKLQHLCQYVRSCRSLHITFVHRRFLRHVMLNEEIQNKESENKHVVLIRKPGNVLLTGLTFQHRTFLIRYLKATKKIFRPKTRCLEFNTFFGQSLTTPRFSRKYARYIKLYLVLGVRIKLRWSDLT